MADHAEKHVQENRTSRREYVRQLVDVYRTTPGTSGQVRRADRLLADQLYDQGVPLAAVENALVLATARRLLRPEGAPPLPPVRSLHYFRAVIDEVMLSDVGEDYYQYLRGKIAKFKHAKIEQ
jgi:hypothetical protein